jgi:hypothetical protein
MTRNRPGVLAARAVNQYRRRDIIPYLALRYFLANECAVRDRWAEEVAMHHLSSRPKGTYFLAYQFKEETGGEVDYREIHLPTPSEALGESLLLDACSKSNVFVVVDPVYSYQLPPRGFRGGMFKPYFPGFKDRHAAITAACEAQPNSQVTFTDIRRFYPNISASLADAAWSKASHEANIAPRIREVGRRLLLDHHEEAPKARARGVLTGPMFSHLLGNLVMKDLDERMVAARAGSYFRYVDDIALVGTGSEVREAKSLLNALLNERELELHPNKEFTVSRSDWLRSKDDFEESDEEPSWMTFVGSLKQMLVLTPSAREEMQRHFLEEGMRIPLLDFSQAAVERPFMESFTFWIHTGWFRRLLSRHSISTLISDAKTLRRQYYNVIKLGLEQIEGLGPFDKKRLIPKLRYAAGRLLYLGTRESLVELSTALVAVPELILLGRVFGAVGARDVSELLKYGTNAAQAAAQVLHLDASPVLCNSPMRNEKEVQALAILKLNGVRITGSPTDARARDTNDILAFAEWQGRDRTLFNSTQPFIKEIACLHGIDEPDRNRSLIDSAFDIDDSLAFDAISMLQGYS